MPVNLEDDQFFEAQVLVGNTTYAVVSVWENLIHHHKG